MAQVPWAEETGSTARDGAGNRADKTHKQEAKSGRKLDKEQKTD